MTKFTIKDFNAKYISDDICLHEIFLNRYGKLKACPNCKKDTKFHKVSNRKCYACQVCGYQLHPLANTIFHKSETSLKNWFYTIFLFANSKNGVSGKELQRQLGVTYKTAWRMAKQIRLLFSKPGRKLGHASTGRGADGKTAVFGLLQRKGSVKAQVVSDAVSPKYLQLYVDEFSYRYNLRHSDVSFFPSMLSEVSRQVL